MAKESNESLLVDKIITPFADYVVVSFDDPYLSKHPEERGGIFDFTHNSCFQISNLDKDISHKIFKFLEVNPSLNIDEERIRDLGVEMPGGTLGKILDYDNIRNSAIMLIESEGEFTNWPGEKVSGSYAVPDMDDCIDRVRKSFSYASWFQLIRNASCNHLVLGGDKPPRYVVAGRDNSGLAIIDCGIGGNCGFGIGKAYFYEVLSIGEEVPDDIHLFFRETLEIRHAFEGDFSFLPSSAYNQRKISELNSRGIVVNLEGNLGFIEISKEQADRIKSKKLY